MESMVSRGVTGTIGTVLVGMRLGSVSGDTRAFVRRNGVDTVLNDMVLTANSSFAWYRIANSGWSATDTIEVGLTQGGSSTTSLNSVALLVEHNTPDPAPLTDTSARVVTVNYTGNGSAQTIDIGPGDQRPTVLFVVPANGLSSVEPLWWWDSRIGAAPWGTANSGFMRVWPQKGKFHVVHDTGGIGTTPTAWDTWPWPCRSLRRGS